LKEVNNKKGWWSIDHKYFKGYFSQSEFYCSRLFTVKTWPIFMLQMPIIWYSQMHNTISGYIVLWAELTGLDRIIPPAAI